MFSRIETKIKRKSAGKKRGKIAVSVFKNEVGLRRLFDARLDGLDKVAARFAARKPAFDELPHGDFVRIKR